MTNRTVIETDSYFTEYSLIPGFLLVRHLYIAPEKRGAGLFKIIHDDYIQLAKDNECKEVLITVDASYDNLEKLINLYEKFDFKVFETDNHICRLYKKVI